MKASHLFLKEKLTKIFTEKSEIIDIGGGLRISKTRGNRYDSKFQWLEKLAEKVSYKILDPVPDFNPDIIGDIHQLPLKDNSVPAIICMSVLEHVENPTKACQEMYRILERGGYAFIYVPFLYYYHAEAGYYKDYWRFTHDALHLLFKDFSHLEIAAVEGPLTTLCKLTPFGRFAILKSLTRLMDGFFYGKGSVQTSGHNIFLVK